MFFQFPNSQTNKEVFLEHKANCDKEEIVLDTQTIEKDRKILFWNLSHKKVIIIDRVLDNEGNTILERKSAFIQTIDSSVDKRFRRIKIVDQEIWIFIYNRKPKNEFIERYNFCGKFIGKRKWEQGDYYKDLGKSSSSFR